MIPPVAATSTPLDSTVVVSTPENVAFDFRLAGPFTRLLAMAIDAVLLAVVLIGLGIGLSVLGASGIGLLLFIGFALWWGYGGLMEAFWNGQTLGKKAIGIRVVSDTGLAINGGQAMLRNVLKSADFFPPFFPGVIAMLFGTRLQRLGDMAAGTMVVLEGNRVSPRPPLAGNVTDRMRERIPGRFRPDAAMIDSLAAYVGRRPELSAARRIELAGLLARHYVRAWSLPPKLNPDHLLCAMYEYATMDHRERKVNESRREEPDEIGPYVAPEDQAVMDHLRTMEDSGREGR